MSHSKSESSQRFDLIKLNINYKSCVFKVLIIWNATFSLPYLVLKSKSLNNSKLYNKIILSYKYQLLNWSSFNLILKWNFYFWEL